MRAFVGQCSWNRVPIFTDQHMDMIRHQVALFDPALLPSRQIVKYLAQVPLYLPEQQLLAVPSASR
jgi:hypothetical protein